MSKRKYFRSNADHLVGIFVHFNVNFPYKKAEKCSN
jgi:hypothetical protein